MFCVNKFLQIIIHKSYSKYILSFILDKNTAVQLLDNKIVTGAMLKESVTLFQSVKKYFYCPR